MVEEEMVSVSSASDVARHQAVACSVTQVGDRDGMSDTSSHSEDSSWLANPAALRFRSDEEHGTL